MSWLAESSGGGTSGATGEIRLLHVEDDEAFADLAATFLERDDRGAPIEVWTETDPRDAVDAIGDVDCVLSDHDMPGMNGLDLLGVVRDEHPNLPFVLLTGRGSEEIASDAISAGVTDYVRKDGSSDQFAVLANTIRNAVERRVARRDAELGERRLRRVVDALPECVLVKTLDGEYLLVNEAGAAHYDATPAELEGRNEREFLRDDLADRFRAEDREVVAAGEPLDVGEQRVRNPDGTERVEHVRKIPFETPTREDSSVLVVAGDVTGEVTRRNRVDEIAELLSDALAVHDGDDRVGSLVSAARDIAVADRVDSD
ncbi:PAS domain-containing protein [Halobacterium litoreum]|uniref:PAS domain-containing protein n=1 Tax=Halobacterium litoreum TaxID=2039234 RepID=A0ABD5NE86_9EURY|nr:PAS domain-containing protein [Halobacterium litoreum]UHH13921.1 PAS domain-containing protein [Halobacterium litoreum]